VLAGVAAALAPTGRKHLKDKLPDGADAVRRHDGEAGAVAERAAGPHGGFRSRPSRRSRRS